MSRDIEGLVNIFYENFGPIFQKIRKNLQNFDKYCNFKILANIKIFGEHGRPICNFSTNILGGRELVQGGDKIFPKVSSEFCQYFVSS